MYSTGKLNDNRVITTVGNTSGFVVMLYIQYL